MAIKVIMMVAAVWHAIVTVILLVDMEKAAGRGDKIAGWIIYTVFEIVTAVLLMTAALMM